MITELRRHRDALLDFIDGERERHRPPSEFLPVKAPPGDMGFGIVIGIVIGVTLTIATLWVFAVL